MSRHPLTCSRCPKWQRGVCVIRGVVMLAVHPVCEYGRRFIKNEWSRLWMARRRKGEV